ncbi:MAG TPA: hypothetical protein VEY11_19700 [Pyrinomonadaceae bacterium]|nr:hypothetical protein [Pyrinomonadaceae bacterium]
MIAPSLYAYLRTRGVRLSLATGSRLQVHAPAGAITEHMRGFIREHAAELAQFIFELEERAAVFEFEQGHPRAEAERLARLNVLGGTAAPDGQLWMKVYAASHPLVREVLSRFEAQVVEVRLVA